MKGSFLKFVENLEIDVDVVLSYGRCELVDLVVVLN